MKQRKMKLCCLSTLFLFAIALLAVPKFAAAQDEYDDPPDRVARLGYLEGSVSMQPAGEPDWVGAVSNRPLTTGDKIWSDQDSRAEVELGSAVIRLSANTGFSLLNLDDRTTQIELTAGSLNIRVRQLNQDDLFEIDTPNQAFSVFRPGNYRVEASEDGSYTVVSVRDGEGESTGNGQTYTLYAGQSATFSGTDSLNAEVADIGGPDQFDNWCSTRDRRYDGSRSASYVSREVVGFEDLDDNGDWRDESDYGHVWYPTRVSSDWAPYRDGHWAWISPWGWTWIDDAPWGYAPFHYGRWVVVRGRWGWIAGPIAVRPVYAPALVVFIGGGGGFGGNVGWFPLGPREVYVPSYRVSRGYVNRVNVSNTTVNVTNITNVYNTTIVNNTNITNVTYVNRNVRGAVTAVPQRTFASAQPVARARVSVNERDVSSASMTSRVAVAPTRDSVLGGRANTANRVTAPPPAVRNRVVIAKTTPPPAPVPFARQQQALAQHPGEAVARRELQNLRPAVSPEARPMVKIAPPGKPATPNMGRPDNQPNQPGNQRRAERPNQPGGNPPSNRPNAAQPGQPAPAPPNNPSANRPGNDRTLNERPAPDNRQDTNRPNNRPDRNLPDEPSVKNDRTPADQPDNRRDNNRPNNRPDTNRASELPVKNDRTPPDQPDNRRDTNRPNNRPDTNRPPDAERNQPNNRTEQPNRPSERPARNNREPDAQPNNRPEPNPNRPAPRTDTPDRPPKRTAPPETQRTPERHRPKPQTPEEKKLEEERLKREQEKPPTG